MSSTPAQQPPAQQLVDAATRIYLRYATEVVEAHGFCPWAKEARKKNQVSVHVLLGAKPPIEQVLTYATRLAQQQETLIGLLVLPQMTLPALEFQHFAARVRDAESTAHSIWAIADFHPCGPMDTSTAERAVALIRRAPDPTLQLVRHEMLSELRAANGEGTQFLDPGELDFDALQQRCAYRPPLAERIANANLRTLETVREPMLKQLQEIQEDRRVSYESTGLDFPSWNH